MSNTQDLKQVQAKKAGILQGDAERIAKQRADGKLTARERVAKLLDQGSFVETDALVSKNGDYAGVVTGYGTVEDRPVYVFAQDYTVHGGAMGAAQAGKILKVLDLAQKTGAPVVAIVDSNGVRLDEGAGAMNAYASVFAKMAKMSGVCPMLCLIAGPCIGSAAILSRLCDVTVMTEKTGKLMVYGAQVLSAVSGKQVTDEAAGGAAAAAAQGGAAIVAKDEDEAVSAVVRVLDLLPSSNAEDAPYIDEDDMNRLIAADAGDSEAIVNGLADAGTVQELYAAYGKAIRTVLCRIGGNSVGLLVSNAAEKDGELTAEASAKAARFVRLCDCYSLPVVTVINSKGVAVPDAGKQVEAMTAVSQLLYAYSEATTAKVSIVAGNAIGQAYVALAAKDNADVTYAWPGAVISALTPEAAVQILYAEELKAGKEPALETRARLEKEFSENVADGVAAAENGMVDDVIDPAETRKYVISAIEMLASKRASNPPKKHGNLPL